MHRIKKENFHVNSVCIGCIGGHITLALSWCHCDIGATSQWRQISKCPPSTSLCLVLNATCKIRHWKSKSVQEKESNMSVWSRKKNLSLGITVWHHLAKPYDAKQWPSGQNFLSAPHTHVRFLCSEAPIVSIHYWSVRVVEGLALPTSDHRVAGSNPAEARFFLNPNGASLHRAFHVHPSIVSKWQKYFWRDVKP